MEPAAGQCGRAPDVAPERGRGQTPVTRTIVDTAGFDTPDRVCCASPRWGAHEKATRALGHPRAVGHRRSVLVLAGCLRPRRNDEAGARVGGNRSAGGLGRMLVAGAGLGDRTTSEHHRRRGTPVVPADDATDAQRSAPPRRRRPPRPLQGATLEAITTQFSPKAVADGFIVVFPQGTGNPAGWDIQPATAGIPTSTSTS